MYVLGLLILLSVPSLESERSCICVRVIDFAVCTKPGVSGRVFVLGLLILPVPSQESERSCICVLELLILPVPNQESERSCICVLGLLILPVPSQESERPYICVRVIDCACTKSGVSGHVFVC